MADNTDYKYYITGDTINILEYDDETYNYLTPTADEDKAILIRYTQSVGSVSSETDDLGVNRNLAQAVIFYVKYRLFDKVGDIRRSEHYYNKFLQYVRKSENTKKSSFSVAVPTSEGVLK